MRKVHNTSASTANGGARPHFNQPASAGFLIPFCAMNLSQEAVATAGAKAAASAPPAVVVGLNFVGITLPDLVQLVSLLWLLILIVDKLWTFYRQWKKEDSNNEPI